MVYLASSFRVLLPRCVSHARDSRFSQQRSRIPRTTGTAFSPQHHRALGSCGRAPASPSSAIRFRLIRFLHLARPRPHLPFPHTRLACVRRTRLVPFAVSRSSIVWQHPIHPLCHAPMTTTATPNHALQRTAPRVTARAYCERSGSYICGVSVRATVGHAPRPAPPSLSLGSLTVARAHPEESQ